MTATVESGVPKHFSSDWAVSHVDDLIRTESNAASEKSLGLDPANLQTGSHDVLSESLIHLNKVVTHIPVINPAHACVPESVKSRFRPFINEEGGVPDGNTDPYLLTSSSITHPVATLKV